MENVVQQVKDLLGEVPRRLQEITPDIFQAPDWELPSQPMHRVGVATNFQQALYTLLKRTEDEHDALHEATGLPIAAHAGLPLEHHKLHTIINVTSELFYQDLTQTFEGLGDKSVYIDNEWNVYWVEEDAQASS